MWILKIGGEKGRVVEGVGTVWGERGSGLVEEWRIGRWGPSGGPERAGILWTGVVRFEDVCFGWKWSEMVIGWIISAWIGAEE